MKTLNQTLDFINLVAYDFTAWFVFPSTVDNQAPLYKRSWEKDPTLNVDYVVKYYISNGITPFKITLGIPFHGNVWRLNTGPCLNQPIYSLPSQPTMFSGRPMKYNEICYRIKNDGWQSVSDPLGQTGPHACSQILYTIGGFIDVSNWVSYDDPSFAIVKSQYALNMGLGGVMVSDITLDDFKNLCGGGIYPMLTAISKTILQSSTTTLKPTSTSKTPTPKSTSKPTTKTTARTSVATTKSPGRKYI